MAEFSLIALAAELAAQAARTRGLVMQVVAKTAADIERDAKIAAPVDTGNLRSSISSSVSGLSAEIGPTANYGGFVELGTARNAPQPYLRPAYDAHLPRFESALERIGAFSSGDAAYGDDNELLDYTTRDGRQRTATRAQIRNWTRGSRS